MAEGYLLVEDIPEGCKSCVLRHTTENGYEFCGAPGFGFDFDVTNDDSDIKIEKPYWCPIKVMPDLQEYGNYYCPSVIEYVNGFNDCLDIINIGHTMEDEYFSDDDEYELDI